MPLAPSGRERVLVVRAEVEEMTRSYLEQILVEVSAAREETSRAQEW